MTLYKPWKKHFDTLLQHITDAWGGQVTRQSEDSLEEVYVYPTYAGEMDGEKFNIEISELVKPSPHVGGASDNIEYLRIKVYFTTELNIQITHESIIERIEKFFHFAHEYETGNKEFDQKFLIRLESDKDKAFISNGQVQEIINRLEPFTLLEISSSGLLWSHSISNEKQLVFEEARRYVEGVVRLVKSLRAAQ